MSDTDNCQICEYSATASCTYGCDVYKIKQEINELRSWIEQKQKDDKYLYIINEMYLDKIIEYIGTSLMEKVKWKTTTQLRDNEICVILDMNNMDWTNFYINNDEEIKTLEDIYGRY